MKTSKALGLTFLVISVLILSFSGGFSGQVPISPELLKKPWVAAWIAPPGRDLTSYGIFHFRKSFELTEKPERFVIHVSADNRYKLYVNGREVCDGPARGDLWHWNFETVDIAGFLNPGRNTLAAVVWNFGEYVPWAQITYATAFVLQGDTQAEAVVNTDETWKVLDDKAYSPIPVDREKMQAFTVVGPGDRVDGSLYPWGWENTNYNDRAWPSAIKVSRATPREIRDADAHWQLVPRTIPPMEKKPQPAPFLQGRGSSSYDPRFKSPLTSLIKKYSMKGSNALLDSLISDYDKKERDSWEKSGKLTFPAYAKHHVRFDQKYLTTAYPQLTVTGGKGSKITVTYSEALFDGKHNKGNRNTGLGYTLEEQIDHASGKPYPETFFGYSDEFRPDGGADRTFSTLWFRTFRYIKLDIETGSDSLIIDNFNSIYVGYPFQEEASFKSDDPGLENIWKVAWRTARLCAGETYFDCPYYEQLNYAGDTRIQALISLYISGDDRLMRKVITHFDDSRISDGLTYSRYPSYMPQIIPPYSLFWIAMVHDYWMYRDDPEFVRSMLPGMQDVLDWFERHLTENDLLGRLPWWNFVDWAPEYEDGVPPGAEDGETSVISLQYVYVLRYAAELAENFGLNHEAGHYRDLAARISAAVLKTCWSEERGLVAETPEKKQFSQHANVMAILVDLVPPDKQVQLMEKILGEKDLIQCTFYYRFYLLRALRKVGRGDDYLAMLGPWYDMLKIGLTTFAEKPEPTRSDCHAWSASPILELMATVTGIETAAPGFKKVRIEPHPGHLKKIEAAMPHPAGKISCSLERKGNAGISGEVVLPEGLSGIFVWQGKEVPLHPGKQQIDLQ